MTDETTVDVVDQASWWQAPGHGPTHRHQPAHELEADAGLRRGGMGRRLAGQRLGDGQEVRRVQGALRQRHHRRGQPRAGHVVLVRAVDGDLGRRLLPDPGRIGAVLGRRARLPGHDQGTGPSGRSPVQGPRTVRLRRCHAAHLRARPVAVGGGGHRRPGRPRDVVPARARRRTLAGLEVGHPAASGPAREPGSGPGRHGHDLGRRRGDGAGHRDPRTLTAVPVRHRGRDRRRGPQPERDSFAGHDRRPDYRRRDPDGPAGEPGGSSGR